MVELNGTKIRQTEEELLEKKANRSYETSNSWRDVEWIRFLIFLFRQDLQEYQDILLLRRGAFRPKAALSWRSCRSCPIIFFKIRIHSSFFKNVKFFIWSDRLSFSRRPRSYETSNVWDRRAGHRARPAFSGIGTDFGELSRVVANQTLAPRQSFTHWSDWTLAASWHLKPDTWNLKSETWNLQQYLTSYDLSPA